MCSDTMRLAANSTSAIAAEHAAVRGPGPAGMFAPVVHTACSFDPSQLPRLQVRTQTLVKNAIIQVDANPFKQWYQQHYGAEIGAKKRSAAAQAAAAETAVEEKSASNHVKRKLAVRAMEGLCLRASAVHAHHQSYQQCPTVSDMGRSTMRIWCCICTMTRDLSCSLRRVQVRTKGHVVDTALDEQFATGRLYACIASRPGQCGRCDGYILEGKELEFYVSGCCAASCFQEAELL